MNDSPVDPAIASATRRIAAFAALRQIRQIIDEEMALDTRGRQWTRWIAVVTAVCVIVAAVWVAHLIVR